MARFDSSLPSSPGSEAPINHASPAVRFSSDLPQYAVKPEPRATFEDVSRAMGRLGGEPIDGPRHAVNRAMLNALNECGATSFDEAFSIFEAARPNWRAELAAAPPQDDTVPHVMEVSPDEIRRTLEGTRFGAHKAALIRTPPPTGPTVMAPSSVHVRRGFPARLHRRLGTLAWSQPRRLRPGPKNGPSANASLTQKPARRQRPSGLPQQPSTLWRCSSKIERSE